jgi:nucleotidyltransferase substrate binding protein (TIGR01987 family)
MDAAQNSLDIRWIQRLNSYQNALVSLESAVSLAGQRPLSELEEQGLIQAFEFTHELAWNLLKDYLESRGFKDIHGSRDTSRLAFKEGYIENGEAWMEMIKSRNASSHTYDRETARTIADEVINAYIHEFRTLKEKMNLVKTGEENVRSA